MSAQLANVEFRAPLLIGVLQAHRMDLSLVRLERTALRERLPAAFAAVRANACANRTEHTGDRTRHDTARHNTCICTVLYSTVSALSTLLSAMGRAGGRAGRFERLAGGRPGGRRAAIAQNGDRRPLGSQRDSPGGSSTLTQEMQFPSGDSREEVHT